MAIMQLYYIINSLICQNSPAVKNKCIEKKMSNLQKNIMKSRLPPLPSLQRIPSKDGAKGRNYSPVMWDSYFAEKKDIEIDRGTFRVYFSKPPIQNGPVLLLLHGGGFSALTWSLFTVSFFLSFIKSFSNFFFLQTEITKMIHCQVLAIDLRGHGDSTSDNDEDLSAETLAT